MSPALKSHTSELYLPVISWLRSLGVRVANTVGEQLAHELLWTCGLKRPLSGRSQIDFIGISAVPEPYAFSFFAQEIRFSLVAAPDMFAPNLLA